MADCRAQRGDPGIPGSPGWSGGIPAARQVGSTALAAASRVQSAPTVKVNAISKGGGKSVYAYLYRFSVHNLLIFLLEILAQIMRYQIFAIHPSFA